MTMYETDARLGAANDQNTDQTPLLAFGDMMNALMAGRAFSRVGWNRPKQFIFLVPGSRFTVSREPLLSILGEGTPVDYEAHIDIKTANGKISVWNPSQRDMVATDWFEVQGVLRRAQ